MGAANFAACNYLRSLGTGRAVADLLDVRLHPGALDQIHGMPWRTLLPILGRAAHPMTQIFLYSTSSTRYSQSLLLVLGMFTALAVQLLMYSKAGLVSGLKGDLEDSESCIPLPGLWQHIVLALIAWLVEVLCRFTVTGLYSYLIRRRMSEKIWPISVAILCGENLFILVFLTNSNMHQAFS